MEPLERACFVFMLLAGFTLACVLIRYLADWWIEQCRDDAQAEARRLYVERDAEETIDE